VVQVVTTKYSRMTHRLILKLISRWKFEFI